MKPIAAPLNKPLSRHTWLGRAGERTHLEALVDIILPVFGIIAAGYGATFTPAFDEQAGAALSKFVFYFAIPVMLFHSLATKELPTAVDLGYFAAYYGGVGLTFALASLAFRLLGVADLEFRVLAGFGAVYGNTVLVGIPVILAAFGDEAGLPLFLLISFHAVILFTAITLMVEGYARGQGDLRQVVSGALKGLLANPILMGLVLGVAFNLVGLELPSLVDRWAGLVSGAALPCALFSIGASLRAYRIAGTWHVLGVIVLLKLIVQPLAVWALATLVFGVHPLWASVAVVAAAMPTGVNAYLFAVRYGKAEAENAAAMLVSTILAVPVLSVLLALLR